MRRLKLALGCVAIACVTATPAMAHEFKASKTGTATGKSTEEAFFKGSFGTFGCGKTTSSGEVKEGVSATDKANISFTECVADVGSSKLAVTFTPIESEVSAEGWISVLKEAKVEVAAAACKMGIKPAENKERKSLFFAKGEGGSLETTISLSALHFVTQSEGCAAGGIKSGEVSISGRMKVALTGGTLEWK